jgi:hypothetical protein
LLAEVPLGAIPLISASLEPEAYRPRVMFNPLTSSLLADVPLILEVLAPLSGYSSFFSSVGLTDALPAASLAAVAPSLAGL